MTRGAAEDSSTKDALAVCPSRAGGIWIGSGLGLTYYDGQAKTYGVAAGLTNPYTKRVFEASDGDVYVVSGISVLGIFSAGKIVASYAASNLVVGMAEDAQGVVASVGGALYRVSRNTFTPYVFTNGVPDMAWILNLAAGRDGEIWVASVMGIFRVKDGMYRQWGVGEGMTDPNAQWICQDSDGVVWTGGITGIARLKDDKIRFITRKNGLFDNNIYSIIPDDFGQLWVDSGRGLFRVSRKNMNEFADGRTNRLDCVAYDGPESVKSSDKSVQEHVACKTQDGRIWFPTANGVVEVDPSHIPRNQIKPPVEIESVWANGVEKNPGSRLVVPSGQGELEIHFAALSFIAPHNIKLRYQLEGYDKDWVETKDRRLAHYTNLKPGSYKFHVIAANADGVWNDVGDILPRGGHETILLVEDEDALRKLARHMLERQGYHVFEADCGATALQLWQLQHPAIDMLVTDMVMPGGIGGRELAERMQAEKPGLKVIYCSGYTDDMLGKDSLLRINGNFLEKPFTTERLLRRVRERLDAVR